MLKNTPYLPALHELLMKKAGFIFFLLTAAVFLLYTGVTFKTTLYLIIVFFLTVLFQFLFLINKSYLLYVVRVCLVIAFCFEFFFGRLNKIREKNQATEVNDSWLMRDPLLGFKLMPGLLDSKAILVHQQDTIFNVSYSSDMYGRRIGLNDTLTPDKTHHAIFLGDSYTFGHGLEANETIPFLFENSYKNYRSYNYGFEAYAPNQVALLFTPGQNMINKSAIPLDSGIALYTFINDHLDRVYGGSIYLSYAPNTPDVFINGDSIIVKHRNKWQLRKAKILSNIQTLKYFHFNFYYPATEDFYKRFAAIINYSAKRYRKEFATGKFFVAIYPSINTDLTWTKFLDPSITLINVPLPADFNSKTKKYLISPDYDIHPSGLLNNYFVHYISKFITKQ